MWVWELDRRTRQCFVGWRVCFGRQLFVCFSFLSQTVWYVGFCSIWYFGGSCFVTDSVFKLLLFYTEAVITKNCSESKQMVFDRKNNNFYEFQPVFGCQNVSSLISIYSCRTEQKLFVLKFCHVMSFYVLQVSFENIYYRIAEVIENLFWTWLIENFFASQDNDWITWRVGRVFGFLVRKSKLFQPVRAIKFWSNGLGDCLKT